MTPPIVVKENVVDRVVRYLSPVHAARRMHARASLNTFDVYTGASRQKRSLVSWITSSGSANRDTLPFLAVLRNRSRDTIRNNPIGRGAVRSTVTTAIGSGLSLESQIDAEFLKKSDDEAQAWQSNTEREFRLFAESRDCDITRHSNFYQLQAEVLGSVMENGDAVTLLPMVKRLGSRYDLRVQLVEADRLCNKDFSIDSPTLAGGVQMDQYGAPTAYHILRDHPGDYVLRSGLVWDVVPAFGARTGRRNVLHHFERERIGQARGVPFLSPVIDILKQISRYTEAEINAAVASGLFAVFVITEGSGIASGVPGLGQVAAPGSPQANEVALEGAQMIDLRPGEDIKTTTPGRPNVNFDPFVLACFRQIGMGLEIPYEVLIKHFTASYTAARAAIIEAWKFYMARRNFIIASFCDPIYEAWMEEAVAAGTIDAPGFFDDPAVRAAYLGNRWHGDVMPEVDPTKAVEAARGRIDLGISDRAQETARLTGGDWETTHKQQVRERQMRIAGGLDPVVPPLKALNAEDPSSGGDVDTETPPAAPAPPPPATPPAHPSTPASKPKTPGVR